MVLRSHRAARALGARLARSRVAPAAACVCIAWLQALCAALSESATWDETYAIAAGYSQVINGDYRLTPENPPLLGWIVTPALQLLDVRALDLPPGPIPASTVPSWGTRFLYDIGNRHDLMLLLSRMSVMALTATAMVALVQLAYGLYGSRGAWLCAVLCAFEPTWLAHGHIAAWDGIAAATMTCSLAALTSWFTTPGIGRALLSGATLGLALAAKHSALALGPVYGGCLALSIVRRARSASGGGDRVAAVRAMSLDAVLMLAAALFVVGLSYDASFDLSRYLASVSSIYRLNNPGFENYLWGEYSRAPFRLYYAAALLVKTPSTALPLLILGVMAALRLRRRGIVPAALLAGVMFVATSFNPYQIGLRHLLPAIPCLILIASGAATLSLGGRSVAPAAFTLGLAAGVEVLGQAPHPIAFFNLVSGGPSAALDYLDDSNIDWGQDLWALASLQRREHLGQLRLSYNGTARPRAHGVDAEELDWRELLSPIPGEAYAISLNHLLRIRRTYGDRAAWLRGPPWRMAGRSIAVYLGPRR